MQAHQPRGAYQEASIQHASDFLVNFNLLPSLAAYRYFFNLFGHTSTYIPPALVGNNAGLDTCSVSIARIYDGPQQNRE